MVKGVLEVALTGCDKAGKARLVAVEAERATGITPESAFRGKYATDTWLVKFKEEVPKGFRLFLTSG